MNDKRIWVVGAALVASLLLAVGYFVGVAPQLQAASASEVQRLAVQEQNAAIALAHADDGYIMELGRVVAADTCEALSKKADVQNSYLGGGAHAGATGTAQRWKRRKTWR